MSVELNSCPSPGPDREGATQVAEVVQHKRRVSVLTADQVDILYMSRHSPSCKIHTGICGCIYGYISMGMRILQAGEQAPAALVWKPRYSTMGLG
jgi:hypothetical protein